MIHLLHHRVKAPGQRVARMAARDVPVATAMSLRRRGGERKALRGN